MKIESSVNLKNFAIGKGCYVWLDPNPETILRVHDLLQYYPEDSLNGTEMHVTVIYSRDLPVMNDVVIEDFAVSGWLYDISIIRDHKDRGILIGNIKSNSLTQLHEKLKSVGLIHSYPDFLPHMTLSYHVENEGVVQAWIENVRRYLPIPLYFEKSLKATPVK